LNEQPRRLFGRSQGKFEFPGPRDRVAIVGGTGEGKTQFGLWSVAESADFDKKPWFFFDYKREDPIFERLIASEDARIARLDKPPPLEPGLYIVQPDPERPDLVANYLWNIYRRGHTGLFFDEMSMLPEYRGAASTGGPVKAILTQGRSKEMPVYALVQRPVDVNLHTFSEAQFLAVFYLKKKEDRKRIAEYLPDDEPIFEDERPLPRYYCRWWNDKKRMALILRPAPDANMILQIFNIRIARMRAKTRRV
jgi:hypothetical protein